MYTLLPLCAVPHLVKDTVDLWNSIERNWQPEEFYFLKKVINHLTFNDPYILVALLKDELTKQLTLPLGVVCLEHHIVTEPRFVKREYWLTSLAVAPSRRGLGIAAELVQRLEQIALGYGAPYIKLETSSPELTKYYEALGYSKIDIPNVMIKHLM
jgi:GNAT superfamily N-acetyltransferase